MAQFPRYCQQVYSTCMSILWCLFLTNSRDLSYNSLNGTIPSLLTTSLEYLYEFLVLLFLTINRDLSYNSLNGTIPSLLTSLEYLYEFLSVCFSQSTETSVITH